MVHHVVEKDVCDWHACPGAQIGFVGALCGCGGEVCVMIIFSEECVYWVWNVIKLVCCVACL